jgi:hypothetical protein
MQPDLHHGLLTHVTVIDVTSGRPVTDNTVVITGDRISAIGSTSTVRDSGGRPGLGFRRALDDLLALGARLASQM